MSGYLGGLNRTGNAEFDAVLDAIEIAGDMYHHTSQWQDGDDGTSLIDLINEKIDACKAGQAKAPYSGEAIAKSRCVWVVEGTDNGVRKYWKHGGSWVENFNDAAWFYRQSDAKLFAYADWGWEACEHMINCGIAAPIQGAE